MAWISVHESVDGSKLREFYKKLKCSKFEALGILNFIWFWGLSNADKFGLIQHADREDVERYIYGAGAGCKIPPDKIFDALLETGWIDEVQDGLYIHDWEEWQEQWYKAIERREKDNKRKSEGRKRLASTVACEGGQEEIPLDHTSGLEEKHQVVASSPPPTENSVKYTQNFESFWEVYPRKEGKGEAYKKYKARRNDGFSDEELLEAAKNYAEKCKKAKTEKQYIKHAKTFLSDATPFIDYLPSKTETVQEKTSDNKNPFGGWEGKD